MTQIAFHFNVPDKMAYACRLVRKVTALGSRLVVSADPQDLEPLNLTLWTFSVHDFLPHCLASDSPSLRHHSTVILTHSLSDLPHHQVLVNLGRLVPDGFEAFERVIELVSQDDADREPARARWKYYKKHGFDILDHDQAQQGAT